MDRSISTRRFGCLPSGEAIDSYALKGAGGVELEAITYGGIMTRLLAPDRTGRMADGWVCTPEDLSLLESHQVPVVLPGPEDIDWTGFPE